MASTDMTSRFCKWWRNPKCDWLRWGIVIPAAQYIFGTCDFLHIPGHRLRLWIWERL